MVDNTADETADETINETANESVNETVTLAANLHFASIISLERSHENKENKKPWYQGTFRRPVTFRANKRASSL